VETSETKNERYGQAEARAAGQVGMREPKKRQGGVLKETSLESYKLKPPRLIVGGGLS